MINQKELYELQGSVKDVKVDINNKMSADKGTPSNKFDSIYVGDHWVNSEGTGYTQLPNGILFQWGQTYSEKLGAFKGWVEEDIVFPKKFPQKYFNSSVSLSLNTYDRGKITNLHRISDDGVFLDKIRVRYYMDSDGNTSVRISWNAIGM